MPVDLVTRASVGCWKGEHHYARLPRLQKLAQDLESERQWLPKLAPHLSLAVPEPVWKSNPTSSYPCSWAIYRWIDGQPYSDELVDDERQAARDLARFVIELRRLDRIAGAPHAGRKPLRELDAVTRAAIESARGVIDSEAATAAWERALEAPAADVIAAWSVFSDAGREVFRDALDVDDGTWNRARGFALHQAAMIIPYYGVTNPGFVTMAKRTVEEVLADLKHADLKHADVKHADV